MNLRIADIVDALEYVAPLSLQESYDNAGLQVGNGGAIVTGALLCIDVTEAVVDEAIELGANLIISHHPLLFKGLKAITGSTYVERVVVKAIQAGVAIYSAHTNMDNALGGVNYKIAQLLQLTQVTPLVPIHGGISGHGSGVVGTLAEPMDELPFLQQLKEVFRIPTIKHTALLGKPVTKVAICGGAGASLAADALACGADLFITGECRYHDYFDYDKRLLLVEAGHYETEQYTKELFCEIITKKFPTFVPYYTKIETNPINYL